jgi:hypothetical protein
MAGAGYKLFNTGDVLTAAQVNTYLQEQVVMVFADATARTTALSGVLAEGMVSYLKDTNATEVYDGSAWVGIGNSGDITGVTAGTGISGGGTSGTVTITNSMATEITAAGDIIVGTGSGTFDNLPIGTTGQVLTADTTVSPYKVKWATASSGGGVTLISSTSPSGVSTVTFSSISQSYKHLLVSIKNLKAASGIDIGARINGNTSTDYVNWNIKLNGSTVSGSSNSLTLSRIRCGNITASATNLWRNYFGDFWIYDYTQSLNQVITGSANADTGSAMEMGIFRGLIDSQAAVTSLTIFDANGNNFTGGTIYLYGVA